MVAQKINPRDIAVEKIIAQLETNPGLWKKTWQKIGTVNQRPFNPISKTQYSGMNMISLALTAEEYDFKDNRWAPFEQARIAGYPVKKGEQSKAIVVYHQILHSIIVGDKIYQLGSRSEATTGNEINSLLQKCFPEQKQEIEKIYQTLSTTPSGFDCAIFCELIKQKTHLDFEHNVKTIAKYTHVFNFSQLENTLCLEDTINHVEWDPCKEAEKIIQSSGVKIFHDQYDNNFYRPGFHEIHLTIKSAFNTTEAYYSTALHELSHAKINDGTIKLSFDPNDYGTSNAVQAKEELRAELSSIFLCANIGLNYDVQNHAAYLQSWLSSFKNNKNELWGAISEADRISDAILQNSRSNNIVENQPENFVLQPIQNLMINGSDYQVNTHAEPKQHKTLSAFICFMKNPDSIRNYQDYSTQFQKFNNSVNFKQDSFILSPEAEVKPSQEVMLNDTRYLNNEFMASIERGVNSTPSRLPPLFTPALYLKILEELEIAINELSNTEPEQYSTKIKAYLEANSDSLVATVLANFSTVSQINQMEVIGQINSKCYELIFTQNQDIINQSETLTKGIKI